VKEKGKELRELKFPCGAARRRRKRVEGVE
jgi:hypothetical protein